MAYVDNLVMFSRMPRRSSGRIYRIMGAAVTRPNRFSFRSTQFRIACKRVSDKSGRNDFCVALIASELGKSRIVLECCQPTPSYIPIGKCRHMQASGRGVDW